MKEFWNNLFLVKPAPEPGWTVKRRELYYAWRIFMVFCAGLCMGLALLVLAVGPYSKRALIDYLCHWQTLLLNTLPVGLLVLLFYGVTGRTGAAFLLGGGIALGFSLGNYYKLQFRDDPLYFEDMLILREAKAMASGDHYALFIDWQIILAVFCLLLGWALLRLLAPGPARPWWRRCACGLAAVAGAAALSPVLLDGKIYQDTQNFAHLNQWSATQNYISHGFWYPFLHSISDFVETPPAGYDEEEAVRLLAEYPDADIPEERKISVVGLMREAYVDFSRYDVPGLDVSGYEVYHALEAESYTGDLVTNIFAGGTVDTERCFLTGNYQLRNFRGNANSYAWYLRDQGYAIQGSHPYYQWFYNRQNINGYLGFQQYRYLEGDYEKMTSAPYPEDSILLPEIYADMQKCWAEGKPCFSFSVNVQSHGPYATWDTGAKEYLSGDGYTAECRNAVNAYMDTIMETDRELAAFIDRLREDPNPVILVTFGDHLPWMGDGNVFYEEMGVDVSPATDEGFYRHYITRYLIWANDAAKEIIGHDVAGEGPAVSPCYLMNLVFDQLGWEGPGFMQAMDEMMEVFPIASTTGRTMTDGVLSGRVPEERLELYRRFQYLQHYWRNEFLYQDVMAE
ncbi:MAG: LTA synthase family protein [Oscillospiraceae bacterium]|nr:LTA synthase family protein [Oscillospiraceae bacterium]